MKVDVTELEGFKKRVEFDIPQDVIEKELNSIYHKIGSSKQVKGFRPGKAPKAILKRLFLSQIESELINTLVPDYYSSAIEEASVDIIGDPEFEKFSIEEGKPLHVIATVNTIPFIEPKNYKEINIKPEDSEVTEEDVDKALKQIQENNAQYQVVEDRPVQEGDLVIIDFRGNYSTDPSKTINMENRSFEIRDDIPDNFFKQLIGAKRGDVVKIKQIIPDNSKIFELRGKDCELDIIIKEIKEKILPVLDDEFAKDIGDYDNLEDLRKELKEELKDNLEEKIKADTEEKVIKTLIENNPFEPPDFMVNEKLDEIIDNFENRLRAGNLIIRDGNYNPEKAREAFRPEAKKSVHLSIILNSIAKKEALTATEDDIDKELLQLASQTKQSLEEIKDTAKKQGSFNLVKRAILSNKAMELVMDNLVKT